MFTAETTYGIHESTRMLLKIAFRPVVPEVEMYENNMLKMKNVKEQEKR